MPGKLFSSTELDGDDRKFVLSDNITHVYYYDNTTEVWDKTGTAGQSWYKEIYSPNDLFDEPEINVTRWTTTAPISATVEPADSLLSLAIERDEGTASLTSDGKWRLSGDFDIRLYIDWDSYYNEYRGATHSFLRVGYDNENAVRVTFAYDGASTYSFKSEKTDSRDVRFFDWRPNGLPEAVGTFTAATTQTFLNITRVSGVIRTYISDGTTTTQVGDDVSETNLTGDLYVQLGLESKETNTYRHKFSKFYVVSGEVSPTTEFFSSIRGTRQDFPSRAVIAVDNLSISIIDEANSKLWMRFPVGDPALLPDATIRVTACNGVVYFATTTGLMAFDFPQDKIYRYINSEIQVADEAIALRNAGVTFRTYLSATGTMPNNNIKDVACREVGGVDYLALVHDSGVTVRRVLAEGMSNSTDGPKPGTLVTISPKGAVFWVGHDPVTNSGEVSFYSNITALAITGTTSFSRTDFYSADTALFLLGNNITAIDVRTVLNSDQLAVGTSDGITFIGLNPGVPVSKSVTFGVTGTTENPFIDPTFEEYIGVCWTPFNHGFQRRANVVWATDWSTSGANSLQLSYSDLFFQSHAVADTKWGVYQDVDLTGVETIYFDINSTQTDSSNSWQFEIVVGETVVKVYTYADGTFIKLSDSVNVLGFNGIQRVSFRCRFLSEVSSGGGLTDNSIKIDNIRTSVGNPTHRILPAGNAAIKEVLLQYDTEGHKIYFATATGYGAVDLDDNSLDYFTALTDLDVTSTIENLSADFVRIEDEA